MSVNRRRLLETLACAGGIGGIAATAVNAQGPALTADVVRGASILHGSNLSPGRLRIVKPIWERRQTALQTLRNLEVDDAVGLTVKL